MKKRRKKIYVLALVLGLAMIWLGFLYTYELKIAAKAPSERGLSAGKQTSVHYIDSDPQAAALGSDAVTAAGAGTGTGFPLVLAGLGMVFILGGVVSYRHRK